jgi:hypothetical protein
MEEHEYLEFKVVMDDGRDTEAQARVAHLDVGSAAYMLPWRSSRTGTSNSVTAPGYQALSDMMASGSRASEGPEPQGMVHPPDRGQER